MHPSKQRTRIPGNILAKGEATGHAHCVTVDVYELAEGLREFAGPTTMSHEEHQAIAVPDGAWLSGRVMEYDHFTDMARTNED